MEILGRETEAEHPITEFGGRGAHAAELASGSGEAHVYRLRFEPGGSIGRHVAGFDQVFVLLEGEGWVEGEDGQRRSVRAGDLAMFARGETHSKGSESGMTALMIQVTRLVKDGGRG